MSSPAPLTTPMLTLAGGTRISRSLVRDEPFIIGSSRSAHFRIPHPSVAPRHVLLLWNGRFTRMEDTSDGAGVQVQGTAHQATNLRSGDSLAVGDFELLYEAPEPLAVRGRDADTGQRCVLTDIALRHGLTFGSSPQADVSLPDDTLLSVHAVVEQVDQGFQLVDKGGAGLLANGHYFDRHLLFLGDRITFGSRYAFIFDGQVLRPIAPETGCVLTGHRLEVQVGAQVLLREAGFTAAAGTFVGIIGPSGSGKTTLLRALCGLIPISQGTLLLNRKNVAQLPEVNRYFGFVPQREIVHLELTGRQALRYAAALRLPRDTPWAEMEKRIAQLTGQLGLTPHLDKQARLLSGGQLKRLGVAVEMISYPPLLLLDEPAAGLDPQAEEKLMKHLRELASSGCTVICSTHLMENLHLMDEVVVVAASPEDGEPGTTIFRGRPSAARQFFEVPDFTSIYTRLRQRKPSEWRALFAERTGESTADPPKPEDAAPLPPRTRQPGRWAVAVLWRRQWDILRADLKTPALLIGQPFIIGLLLALASSGGDSQSAARLFLATIATFWMACGNAASEIVRERNVLDRERFAGLSTTAYLTAKYSWLWGISCAQALLLFIILKLLGGVGGSLAWQVLALGATAFAATGLGLAVSAWARQPLQAVLLVPVLTIPQILFSGYVFELKNWDQHTAPRVISRFFPGFASQRMVDTSLLWQRPVTRFDDMDKAGLVTAYENLTTALRPPRVWWNPAAEATVLLDEPRLYASAPGRPLAPRVVDWDVNNPPQFRLGAVFAWAAPAWRGLLALAAWGLAGAGLAACFLRIRRE